VALVLRDRVKTVTSTEGQGALGLGTAIPGFQPFSILGDGNETYYTVVDPTTGDFEVGVGTYLTAGNSLTRDIVLDSSESGAKVDFGSGPKDVFVTLPAERAVFNNADGSLVYDPAGSAIIFAIALG
jgi:hypothetical protein